MNATGTELLDRFDRIQAPDRKGAMEKDGRKSEALRFILRLLMSRGSSGGRSGNICSAKRTHGIERTFKGPNLGQCAERAHFNTRCASTAICSDFWSWNLIQMTGERAKCNRGRANEYKERLFLNK